MKALLYDLAAVVALSSSYFTLLAYVSGFGVQGRLPPDLNSSQQQVHNFLREAFEADTLLNICKG